MKAKMEKNYCINRRGGEYFLKMPEYQGETFWCAQMREAGTIHIA